MTLFAALHSDAGTFHSFAAAWISMVRAAGGRRRGDAGGTGEQVLESIRGFPPRRWVGRVAAPASWGRGRGGDILVVGASGSAWVGWALFWRSGASAMIMPDWQ